MRCCHCPFRLSRRTGHGSASGRRRQKLKALRRGGGRGGGGQAPPHTAISLRGYEALTGQTNLQAIEPPPAPVKGQLGGAGGPGSRAIYEGLAQAVGWELLRVSFGGSSCRNRTPVFLTRGSGQHSENPSSEHTSGADCRGASHSVTRRTSLSPCEPVFAIKAIIRDKTPIG